MTEAQWRFLKAITDRLPGARIVELRLFPAIRQGGTESGVAVVAVETLEIPPPIPDPTALDTVQADVEQVTGVSPAWETPRLSMGFGAMLSDSMEQHGSGDDRENRRIREIDGLPANDRVASEREVVLSVSAEREVPLPIAADFIGAEADEAVPLDDMLNLAAADAAIGPTAARAPRRIAVLAARYRLMLKGPDRGRWDFELTHEADAPIETVDRVARGVAKRAGDEGEPESYSADQLRSALAQPWWTSAT
ncbi:MAG: hypothetical protein MNPFHGCM_01149 [Gemmatimonadaceae bacterium]|nr:hypothetical protein [Gemmatimonadaceae bacterium]